jgi:hypothetical protein
MSADQPTPRGTECANRAQDADRLIGQECRFCGHQACGMGYQPCDICRLTIRIIALEEQASR